jgi:aspartate aminotransferase/aminotransferase
MELQNLLSSKVKDIGSASSIQQNEKVYELISEGINPIILSYGEAPFSIKPIFPSVKQWDRGAHYSQGLGVPEFREAIAAYSRKWHQFDIKPTENIMVTAGSKIGCYYVFMAFMNPGENLVLHEPSWVSYREHARLCGGETRFIDSDQCVYDALVSSYRPSDKIICLNNPNNPRGTVYSEKELRSICGFCLQKNLILVVDESYSDFCNDGDFFSAGQLVAEGSANVIVLNSISKNFGLSGWRLGYIIASKPIIEYLNRINQHLMTCASTNLQLALVGELDTIRQQVQPQINDLKNKRIAVEAIMRKMNINFLSGSATFYHFLDFRNQIYNSAEFVVSLLEEKHVSMIPGKAYGQSTEGFLRLSFAIEPLERIEEGLVRLKDYLND